MAFASVGNIGRNNSTTAGLTLTVTAAAQLDAGNLGILAIAVDNQSTTDGNTSEISTVVDTALNTWTKLREFCNSQGASNAGATVSVWYTIADANLPITTGVVTITLANSKTSKAATIREFTIGAGNTISLAGQTDLATDGAANPGSMTISGLSNQEYLFFRGIAGEINAQIVVTPTTGFAAIQRSEADTGTGGTSVTADGEWRILTDTSSTSNPTGTTSADHASTFLAIQEVVPAGQPIVKRFGGVQFAHSLGRGMW